MKRLVACLAIVLACAWAYAPVADNGFVDYDDNKYLTDNPVVQEGLTAEGFRWAFDNRLTANFHPLTWLSHMLDVELFGLEPGPHHLMGVGLHALAACVLFLAFAALGVAFVPALLAALLFAVHPLRVESVAWASERKDVLSGLFFALTLLAWAGHARAGRRWCYAAAAVCLGLGLLAKSMLVTLPLILLLVDAWPLRRPQAVGWRRLVLEKLPLFGIAAAFAVVALYTQGAVGAVRSQEDVSLVARVANACGSYWLYAWKSVWPTGLAVFHPHPAIVRPDAPAWTAAALGGLAGFALVSALAWGLRRRAPAVLVGWLWFLIMLLPVIGLVQVGEHAWAGRYAYLPTVGLFLAILVPLWSLVHTRPPGRLAFGVAGLALVVLAGLGTRTETARWRDTRTLFEHALRVTEKNYLAEIVLAQQHERAGELEQARQGYERAVAACPRSVTAHSNLGVMLLRLGRDDEAHEHIRIALDLQPAWPEAWNNLGILHARNGRMDEALDAFARATDARPDFGEAWRNRGGVLAGLGRLDEALAAYEEAGVHLGENARLFEDRARIHQARGEPRRAIELYQRALKAHAGGPPPLGAAGNLAWILATCPDPALRDGAAAVRLATSCVRATGERDPRLLATLAAAHAEAGSFEEAVRWQSLAIERAGSAGGELGQQLEHYRAGRPWRTGP